MYQVFCCCYLLTEIEAMLGFTETKIISDSHLSLLVRQMAVHADVGQSSTPFT